MWTSAWPGVTLWEKSMTRCSLVCERRGDDLRAAYFILLGGVHTLFCWCGMGWSHIQAGWASTVHGSRPELLKIGLHMDETAVTMSLYTYTEHPSIKTSLLEPQVEIHLSEGRCLMICCSLLTSPKGRKTGPPFNLLTAVTQLVGYWITQRPDRWA